MRERWHLTARPVLSLRDRLRILAGVPLHVRFVSPDGGCHAACEIQVAVQREWPDDDAMFAQTLGWTNR